MSQGSSFVGSVDAATRRGLLELDRRLAGVQATIAALSPAHSDLTGLGADDHPQYLLKTGGTVSGAIKFERHEGVNSLVLNNYTTVHPSSNVYLYSPPNDRDAWVYLDSADTGSNWGIYHRQIDTTVGDVPGNSIAFVGGGSSAANAYIQLTGGNFWTRGNVTVGAELYMGNWIRFSGEKGFYSQSYGQHFYPDSGGYYWDIDGALRFRDGYEGTIQGYMGYNDAGGFGSLASNGAWWLNNPTGDGNHLVIGGWNSLTAYGNSGARLLFRGGDADARSNYYIGTNHENYGGNYSKLDMFWHTGVRIAAMRQYGGIRMYGSITGGSLSDELFSVGKGDGNVRTTNSLISGGNVAVTRPNAIMLAGPSDNNHKIYSVNAADTGLPWSDGPVLVGYSGWAMYDEQYDIWRMGVRGSNTSGVRYGWYNCNLLVGNAPDDSLNTHRLRVQGTGYFTGELQTANKLNANLVSNQQWWGGTVLANTSSGRATFVMHPGGVAPQFIGVQNDGTVYLRNSVDSGYRALAAIIYNQSSRHLKQDIVPFPAKITSPAGSAVNEEYFPSALTMINKLRPVFFRWKKEQDLDQIPTGRRLEALKRLQKIKENRGEPFYDGPDLYHQCGRDCDGSESEPCLRVRNWQNGKIGLIAQEVAEVVPECANLGMQSGEYESLDSTALSALCIAALQEISKRIDEMQGAS